MGHFIVLKVLGYRIGLIVVGPFIYTKNSKRSSLTFNLSGQLIFGGCVIPEINDKIYDEVSLDISAKQYIKVLFGGVFGTIALVILSGILIIFNKYNAVGVILLIINWLVLINTFQNSNLVFGDYCLISLIKSSPCYLVSLLLNNLALEHPMNTFVKIKMSELLDRIISNEQYNELLLSLAEKVLDEYIIEGNPLDKSMSDLKHWVFNNYQLLDEGNFPLRIAIIKASYKFLLYEYSIGKHNDFIEDYKKFKEYLIKYEQLKRYDDIKRMMNTLKEIEEKGSLKGFNSEYIISDLENLLSNCDNYTVRTKVIIEKLLSCK